MSESIVVKRNILTDKSTVGEMYGPDGTFWAFTLEDVCRKEKVQNMTAIPAGRYEVILNWSERYKRQMPRVLNVPLFTGILIHSGNYPSHTSGCILVGKKKGDNAIFESLIAFDEIFPKIKKLTEKGKLFLEVDGGFKIDEWAIEKDR